MRTLFIAAAAAAAALTATVGMAREGESRFVHGGQTYVYTTTEAANGRQVIEGQRLPSGSRFRLVVRGDKVSGVAGGAPVSFKVREARGAAGLAAISN